jgi:hypothetical protein
MGDAAADERVKLREGAVSWREVDGEAILLDLETSAYLGVNATGTVLWPLLDTGTTPAAMAAALVERFEVEPDVAREDVGAFLEQARRLRLLEG